MMRHKAFHQLDDVIREHEKSKMQLEAQKQQLMQQELELRKREALNESEKRKLQLQKEMVKKRHTENYFIFFLQVMLQQRESRDDTLWVSKILQLFVLKMFNIILSDLKEFELFEHIQCGQHRLSANTCLPDNMVTGINSNTRSVDVF